MFVNTIFTIRDLFKETIFGVALLFVAKKTGYKPLYPPKSVQPNVLTELYV